MLHIFTKIQHVKSVVPITCWSICDQFSIVQSNAWLLSSKFSMNKVLVETQNSMENCGTIMIQFSGLLPMKHPLSYKFPPLNVFLLITTPIQISAPILISVPFLISIILIRILILTQQRSFQQDHRNQTSMMPHQNDLVYWFKWRCQIYLGWNTKFLPYICYYYSFCYCPFFNEH